MSIDARSIRRHACAAIIVLALVASACTDANTAPQQLNPTTATAETLVAEPVTRADPPLVGGRTLTLLPEPERAAVPAQWNGGDGPVPYARWWGSLVAEKGIHGLWGYPLLLRMAPDGRIDLGVPGQRVREDGYPDAATIPTMFLQAGSDATIAVLDEGAFHVRFALRTATAELIITMVQGSPFLEIDGSGELLITVPGLQTSDDSTVAADTGPADETLHFDTATGPWMLATAGAPHDRWDNDGDLVTLRFGTGSRMVLGPQLTSSDQYRQIAEVIAGSTLITTTETLSVEPTGVVRQVLAQHREGVDSIATAWTLLPHQSDSITGDPAPIATVETPRGTLPVVSQHELVLEYPAVPILWSPVLLDDQAGEADVSQLPPPTSGSYFGGKYAYAAAFNAQLAEDDDAAAQLGEIARQAIADLASPAEPPQVRWDPGWGAPVLSPAEFGAGVQLNDHQLQNGYWVGAASLLAESRRDPELINASSDLIDLIIADYAGTTVMERWSGTVTPQGTWSAYDGHSWASGTSPFGSGNNLESISESSFAWWAAARWFITTDRPELAEPFIARFTIESWLTGYYWLPSRDLMWPDVRPWSGVVWASKIDPGTWFHPSPEAALGIRLLPLGPQSFSRYPDRDAIEAAATRWQWCEQQRGGCRDRWANLLDSDAVVAGAAPLAPSNHPEESTSAAAVSWWRTVWEQTAPAVDWTCTPGVIARRQQDDTIILLISNPGTAELTIICRVDDEVAFEASAPPLWNGTTLVDGGG